MRNDFSSTLPAAIAIFFGQIQQIGTLLFVSRKRVVSPLFPTPAEGTRSRGSWIIPAW
jgi:hypothetical protein